MKQPKMDTSRRMKMPFIDGVFYEDCEPMPEAYWCGPGNQWISKWEYEYQERLDREDCYTEIRPYDED